MHNSPKGHKEVCIAQGDSIINIPAAVKGGKCTLAGLEVKSSSPMHILLHALACKQQDISCRFMWQAERVALNFEVSVGVKCYHATVPEHIRDRHNLRFVYH